MATLLRSQINSRRSRSRARLGPYGRLSRYWSIIFASALLDPLIPYVVESRAPEGATLAAAAALGVLLLPCLAQARFHKMVSRLRVFNQASIEKPSKALSAMILFALSAGLLPKLVAAAVVSPVVFVSALLLFGVLLAKGFRKAVKQQRSAKSLLADNPWVQVERWEVQLITFSLLPMIAARAIGFCGVLLDAAPDDLVARLPYFITCVLFLAMLRPDKRLFLGHCKRCRMSVPIVFVDIGSCLRCDQKLFHSYLRATNPGLFPPLETPPEPEKPTTKQ